MDTHSIDLSEFHHSTPVQIRFNDIDILGHLNNIVYFALYDLAKAHYLQTVRSGQMDWQKVESVIANVNCSYIKQVKFGEEMEVLTRCIHLGDRSFTLRQCLVETTTREVRSVCDTVMVCFDPATGTSAPMRPDFRKSIQDFELSIPTSETKN